ncbi:MAG: rhomboid family protein [Flavipsychrobacter sp.]|jgi:membrane associated rhomboid family serine protease|nr:rhomboid family protein [Flavipsychrobacter sp.]
MNTGRKRSGLLYIPGYSNNAVLQLIFFSAGASVMLGVTWGILQIVYEGDASNFLHYFLPNIGLPPLSGFKYRFWTILTYGWFNYTGQFNLSFLLNMLSNMLWLYCFGSLVQMLVGHKQVIPLYTYSLVTGGVFYLLVQLFPGKQSQIASLLTPQAGLVGLATAAVTLAPQYRFYITETFRIHILVVAGIFAFLMLMGSGFYLPVILLMVGGGLMGYGYVKLLKAGYRPGEWMYSFSSKVNSTFDPGLRSKKQDARWGSSRQEMVNGVSQKRIDDILDKINQKGYNSLSAEEKEILLRAGKE